MASPNEKILQKLANGQVVYGSHICSGTPILTECMAQCGFDVLWIDTEHTAIGMESLVNNLIAARAGGTPAWVRVPWNDPVRVKPVIDMGADGIIFPYVRTAEEAALAAASCSYPPKGIRGYGPMRPLRYGAIPQLEFVHNQYRDCLRILQIEHIDAVKNLREIAAVEGIDAFIVGPNDLSGSMGMLGETERPEMLEVYDEIVGILKEMKRPFGVSMGYNEQRLKAWHARGAQLLFAGSDVDYVFQGAASVRDNLRRIDGKL